MNEKNYVAPEFHRKEFHCPECNVYAHQVWKLCFYEYYYLNKPKYNEIEKLQAVMCAHCKKFSLWVNGTLVYPSQITVPIAHIDMPQSVSEYYNEAREVSAYSSRAAAALLRIAAKKLCEHLGEDEPNLNQAIGNLSKRGLSLEVIRSLDSLRIVGNEGGAHEGQIDLTGKDNKQIVDKLFWLVNFIVEKTITEPNEVKGLFESLPGDKKAGAEKRDQ